MSAWSKTIVRLGAIAALAMVFAGCDKEQSGMPTAHLRGTVTVNGAAIPADAAGAIIFQPVTVGDAHPASSPIKDGKYDVAEAPIGKLRAVIHITQELPAKAGVRQFTEFKTLVPERLMEGQEIQVAGDNLNLNFDLK
jgi:hypothetical protein